MTKEEMGKKINKYMKIDYLIEVRKDKEGYFAYIPDLPGCMAHGSTLQELEQDIEEAKREWFEIALEIGKEIPLPSEYSGKTVLRMPKTLHERLARNAQREGVSLNQFILFLLSSTVEKQSILREVEEIRWKVGEIVRHLPVKKSTPVEPRVPHGVPELTGLKESQARAA